jgi:hypothetical protein
MAPSVPDGQVRRRDPLSLAARAAYGRPCRGRLSGTSSRLASSS